MVNKFIFNIHGDYPFDKSSLDVKKRNEIISLNDLIHQQLVSQKNSITHYHKSRKWDKYKKMTNDYELIFTSTQGCPSIAEHFPISRSYFKLWEILTDFRTEINFPDVPLNVVFLADAPGGFGEAFLNFRNRNYSDNRDDYDNLYGMSLKATNKIIPSWKFDENFCRARNLKLLYGEAGNGNLYDISNIHSLVDNIGKSSCQFITADGGFDFSSDFNNQEEMSLRLVLCEIYAALQLQAQGGTFILKIYDIHNIITMKLLYILKLFYEDLYFTKPLSSRPANSEKYVVCTNFNVPSVKVPHYKFILTIMRQNIVMFNKNVICKDIDLPSSFMLDIVHFNRIYIMNQTIQIMKTLSLIEKVETTNDINEFAIIKHQLKKAIKWCYKYKIKVSKDALKKYKTQFWSPTTGLI